MTRVWDIASPTYDVLFEEKLQKGELRVMRSLTPDAVNSVQFSAYQPHLLTCAGSRAHLQAADIEFSSDEDTDSDDGSDDELEDRAVHVKTGAMDACLTVWSFGQQ